MEQSVNERLSEVATQWDKSRKLCVFDIEVHKSASGRDGTYVVHSGISEFIPNLSFEHAKGFERSMWAVMWGGKSKYLK